jgi:hypothetical protein
MSDSDRGRSMLLSEDPQYRVAPIMRQSSCGDEKRLWSSSLYLPVTLPHDHGDRTRIELLP